MNKAHTPRKVAPSVFMVGGPDLTDPRDCLCYLVDGAKARVLIDCGPGPARQPSWIWRSRPRKAAHPFIAHPRPYRPCRRSGGDKAPHRLPSGHPRRGRPGVGQRRPQALRRRLVRPGPGASGGGCGAGRRRSHRLVRRGRPDHPLHPRPHPGSVAAWCLAGGHKVLFGQDVHGPFAPPLARTWGSGAPPWSVCWSSGPTCWPRGISGFSAPPTR